MDKNLLALMIDHTVLKATATPADVRTFCEQAKQNGFASVCINPCYVKLAAELLKGTQVKVCTVIGFPLGANTTEVKAFEANKAVAEGAEEVDMVINVGMLKDGNDSYVENDIREVVKASKGSVVKVIIETCYLTEEEKIRVCKLSQNAGASFVKTSTGFGTGGANIEDIKLMRKTIGTDMLIKASGGIKSKDDALGMIQAGANRIGTSSGLAIIE